MDISNVINNIKQEFSKTIEYQLWLIKKFNEAIIKEEWDLFYKLYIENLDYIIDSLKKDTGLRFLFAKLLEKHFSGILFPLIVYIKGSELFGSAKYSEEKLLLSNDYFNLTYIPAKQPSNIAIFHTGGILPYSDKIFRFLPEINFYDRFLESGISVYAMELKGNKYKVPNYNSIKLEKILDTIDEFSKIAFIHNQKRKMILEGYCGLGIQALSYIMAYPEHAEERFSLASLFVSPINGKSCGVLSEVMNHIPNYLIELGYFISKIIGEVPFITTQTTQDLALNSVISKTIFGLYYHGWKIEKYHIQDLWNKELLLDQKKELAGTYWISPLNGFLFPIPLDLAKFYTRLYKQGISEDGILPWKINNQNLDLKIILEKTTIKIIGFYGKKDKLVPDNTAEILKKILDYRYKHIAHEDAGHISYVLSPEVWSKNHKKKLEPNPIDFLKQEYV